MKWISLKKETPPMGELVLLFKEDEMYFGMFGNFYISVGSLWELDQSGNMIWKKFPEEDSYLNRDLPTHWMPLPELPEERPNDKSLNVVDISTGQTAKDFFDSLKVVSVDSKQSIDGSADECIITLDKQ